MVSRASTKIKGPNPIEKAHWRFGNGITWLGWWVCKGGLMAESIEGFCVKSKDLVVSDKNLITPSNCFFLHNPDKFLYAPNIRIKIPQFEHQYSLIEKCHFSFCWKRGLPMIKCKKMAEKGSPVALALSLFYTTRYALTHYCYGLKPSYGALRFYWSKRVGLSSGYSIGFLL